DATQRRRLAAAAGTEQRENRTRRHFETHVPQNWRRLGVAAKRLVQSLHENHDHSPLKWEGATGQTEREVIITTLPAPAERETGRSRFADLLHKPAGPSAVPERSW